METVKSETWQPLPLEVAEWMGASDTKEPLADVAKPIVMPNQRGVWEWLKRLFRPAES